MEMKRLSPWNWFRNEQNHEKTGQRASPTASHHSVQRMEQNLPFMRLHQEIDRLFDDAFRGLNFPVAALFGHDESGGNMQVLRPAVDIAEHDTQYTITIEVPGIDENDIQVQVDDDALIIQGEKKLESERRDANFHRVERSFGSFQRVLTLPVDADAESINASFKNGVLTLTIDRIAEKAPKQPRLIPIGGSSPQQQQNKIEQQETASS